MIFDVESDGLLEEATKIHVMSYKKDGEVRHTFDYDEMRSLLTEAKLLIGHNIIRYDIPLLEKLLNIKIKARLIDTLALSWYLNHRNHVHGLDWFGRQYGVPKPKIDDWDNLSLEEYAHRCDEDVRINSLLWEDLKDKLLLLYGSKKEANRLINYLSFKMDCAREQERSGWKLDIDKAQKNLDDLLGRQEEIVNALIEVMPPFKRYGEKTKPKKPYKKDGTLSVTGVKWFNLLKENDLPEDYDGSVSVLVSEETPNPNSPDQIKDWMFSLGWVPQTFKYVKEEDGSERQIPQLRVESGDGKDLCPSIYKLAEQRPEIELLKSLSVIQHRIGVFKGFLENHKDGWLKAEVSGFTNTLRFKHKVIVNLPGVDKAWGEEIRGSLIAPEGQILCGSDMCSLESNTKKHYMFPYDPDYVAEMSKEGFDEHLDLAKLANEVSQKQIDLYNKGEAPELKVVRNKFKPANYAGVYGVREKTLSRQTGMSEKDCKRLLDLYWERNWAVLEVAKNTTVKSIGADKWLYNPVSKLWYSLRYEKDRFSTLNQGTGVYCFDSWIREFRKKRSQLTGQMHDEIIACIKEGQEERYEKLLKDCISIVNERLKLNVKLDVDVQFGKTYAEIH